MKNIIKKLKLKKKTHTQKSNNLARQYNDVESLPTPLKRHNMNFD